jgi:hypothetical protein
MSDDEIVVFETKQKIVEMARLEGLRAKSIISECSKNLDGFKKHHLPTNGSKAKN